MGGDREAQKRREAYRADMAMTTVEVEKENIKERWSRRVGGDSHPSHLPIDLPIVAKVTGSHHWRRGEAKVEGLVANVEGIDDSTKLDLDLDEHAKDGGVTVAAGDGGGNESLEGIEVGVGWEELGEDFEGMGEAAGLGEDVSEDAVVIGGWRWGEMGLSPSEEVEGGEGKRLG